MPGEFISEGGTWSPALVQRHEFGSIRVEDAKKTRIMDAVTKVMPDPDNPSKTITMTKRQELGDLLTVEDPNHPGRVIPMVGPDKAALETIRKTLGEGFEDAREMKVSPYPDLKKDQVIVNAAGDPAMAATLAEQAKQIEHLKSMVESLAKKDS